MRLTDISAVREILQKNGFSFSKALGQNFLINPTVCPRIAQLGGCGDGVCALEIGAGAGVLTRELSSRCDKVLSLEVDERLRPVLSETLSGCDNTEVIFEDAMTADLAGLIRERFGDKETVVCANLPYYITSPVIMRILESRLPVSSVTVMVQKEAADRICARPGTRECGAISLAVSYYSEPKTLFRVSRGSFLPAPKVDSAVIRLDIKKEPLLPKDREERLFRLIRAGFSERRKTLVNPLSAALKRDKSELSAALSELSIKPSARAEELTLEDFIRLEEKLFK